MIENKLIDYVRKYSLTLDPCEHNFDSVIYESVGDYMAYLMEYGVVPFSQLDALEDFLTEDADELLKKLTYGCNNLEEFQINYFHRSK